MISPGVVGWGVILRVTGGAMGLVRAVEHGSVSFLGSVLGLAGPEGSIEFEV